MSTIGISTSWLPFENSTPADCIRIASELGVRLFEIGVSYTKFKVEQYIQSLQENASTAIVVHNIFSEKPFPEREKRGEALCSTSNRERKKALELTFRTVEVALKLGAKIIHLHLGGVELSRAHTRQLKFSRYIKNFGRTKELQQEINRLLTKRKKNSKPFFDCAFDSLNKLTTKFPDVNFSIENGYFFTDIPSSEELSFLLKEFGKKNVSFCFDIGHAYVLDYIGFVPVNAWLENSNNKFSTIHIHDALRIYDHKPIGAGSIQFDKILNSTPKDVPYIIELSGVVDKEEVRRSIEAVKKYLSL